MDVRLRAALRVVAAALLAVLLGHVIGASNVHLAEAHDSRHAEACMACVMAATDQAVPTAPIVEAARFVGEAEETPCKNPFQPSLYIECGRARGPPKRSA